MQKADDEGHRGGQHPPASCKTAPLQHLQACSCPRIPARAPSEHASAQTLARQASGPTVQEGDDEGCRGGQHPPPPLQELGLQLPCIPAQVAREQAEAVLLDQALLDQGVGMVQAPAVHPLQQQQKSNAAKSALAQSLKRAQAAGSMLTSVISASASLPSKAQ